MIARLKKLAAIQLFGIAMFSIGGIYCSVLTVGGEASIRLIHALSGGLL